MTNINIILSFFRRQGVTIATVVLKANSFVVHFFWCLITFESNSNNFSVENDGIPDFIIT